MKKPRLIQEELDFFYDKLVKAPWPEPKEELETIERDDWIYIYGKESKNLYLAISKECANMIVNDTTH